MATANVNINLTDNGSIGRTTDEAKALTAELRRAAASASSVSPAVQAARRGVAASARGREDGEASGLTRSIGPGTGAAGRDFAKQSQGLGGLVQVYATFAANLFAATAAFSALSKAADVSNLVKGLDQLGAASGKNLGSLAKDLVKVTDGAISLEDALRSTANASAGGLSATNILRLGKVAKTASQALGVSMPDAVNRLTRGITKLEPELLDEIGIMVRLDDATRKYASSIGKTSTSLTDFERRQAFANAVLAQGEAKFGAIDLAANPYSKLLATVQNLSIAFGQLLNTALSPVLSILNASPAALSVALAGIASILLKQAIPALTDWRARLDKAAESQRKFVIESANARKQAARLREIDKEDKIIAPLITKLEQAKASAQAAINKLDLKKALKGTVEILPTSGALASQEEIDKLDKQAQRIDNILSRSNLTDKTKQARLDEVAGIRAIIAAKKEQLVSETQLDKLIEDRPAKLKEYFSVTAQQERIANKASQKSQRLDILNNITDKAPILGVAGALRELNANVRDAQNGIDITGKKFEDGRKNMTNFNAVLTKSAGAFRIVGQAAGTLISSLGSMFMYAGIVAAAFQILDSVFSQSAKQLEDYSNSLETLNSASTTVQSSLQAIAKKSAADKISTESSQALATSLLGVSDAVESVISGLQKLVDSQRTYDRFKDKFLDIFGFSATDDLGNSLATSILASLDAIEDPKIKAKAERKISKLFKGIDIGDKEAVAEFIDDLDLKDALATSKEVGSVFKLISGEVNTSAAALTSFKSGLDQLSTEMSSSMAKLLPKDEMSKIGTLAVNAGKSFNEALKDPQKGLVGISVLLKDINSLSILPTDSVTLLLNSKNNIDALLKSLGELRDKIRETEKLSRTGSTTKVRSTASAELDRLQRDEARLLGVISAKNAEFARIGQELVVKGNEKLLQSFSVGIRQAGLEVQKSALSAAKNLGVDTTARDREVIKAETAAQVSSVNALYANVEATTNLSLQLEKLVLTEKEKLLNAKNNKNDEDRAQLAQIVASLKQLGIAEALKKSGNIKSITAAMSSNNPDEAGGAAILQTYVAQTLNKQLELVKLKAAEFGKLLQNSLESVAIKAAAEVDIAVSKDKQSNIDSAALGSYASLLGVAGNFTLEKQKQFELDKVASDELKQKIKLQSELDQLEKVRKTAGDRDGKIAEKIKSVEADKGLAEREAAQKRSQINDNYYTKSFEFETQLRAIQTDRLNQVGSITKESLLQESDLRLQELSSLQQRNLISEEYYAKEQERISLSKLELDYFDQLRSAALAYREVKLGIDNKLSKAEDGSREKQFLEAEAAAAQAAYATQVSGITRINAFKVSGIELTKQQTDEQIKLNLELKNQEDIIKGLEVVFGSLGSAVGDLAASMFEATKKSEELTKQRDNEKIGKSAEEQAEIEDKFAKKRVKLEDETAIKAIGSTKKLFKEKTAAYKLFAGLEKGLAAIKLANSIREMVMDASATVSAVANSTTRATVKGKEAVVDSMKDSPWFMKIAIGALVAAAVASVLGGGSSVNIKAGSSAADRQETQGTGMSWVDGKKVENGGGVFGDADAKSKSIQNSLDRIKETSIEGLTYDSKTVKLLESINEAIGGAARNLYGVAGLRTGTGFGTKESTKTSGITGLFGSTTSKNIIDSGVKFVGSFIDLALNKAGSIQQYETLQTTKKKSGFLGIGGSTSVKTSDQFKDLDAGVAAEISNIFSNATDLFLELGDKLGRAKEDILAGLASVPVAMLASLRGLKGAELEEELGNIISAMMDSAAGAVFDSLLQYRKFGEGMAETVLRVLDTNEKVLLSFKSLGIDSVSALSEIISEGITTEQIKLKSIEITEALASLAGGLDEFLDKQRFFLDNFLSEAERLAPIQKDLTERLAELGLSSIDTKEEFKALTLTLAKDLSNPSARELYNTLLDLAPAFAKVYESAQEALSVLEMRQKVEAQQIKILELLGDEESQLKIVAIRRAAEIEELKKYPAAQSEILIANQEYIYALEDEKRSKDKLIKQRDALDKLSKSLQTSLDSLTNYREVLLAGDKSILTPLQKYQEVQSEFERLRAVAASTTSSEEEKTKALSELPTAADKFLDSSRLLFASGDKYITDFNSVLNTLDSNTSILSEQKSAADMQLEEIKTSNLILDSIDDTSKLNIDYTRQLINELQAQKIVSDEAKLVSDSAMLVWQQDMLAAVTVQPPVPQITIDLQPLVNEIVGLKEALRLLREEQEAQTNAIIITNDQSTQAAAVVIAKTVEETSKEEFWRTQTEYQGS